MFGTPISLRPHEPSPLPQVSCPSFKAEIQNNVELPYLPGTGFPFPVQYDSLCSSELEERSCRWGLIAGAAQLAVPKGWWAARRFKHGHLELSLLSVKQA